MGSPTTFDHTLVTCGIPPVVRRLSAAVTLPCPGGSPDGPRRVRHVSLDRPRYLPPSDRGQEVLLHAARSDQHTGHAGAVKGRPRPPPASPGRDRQPPPRAADTDWRRRTGPATRSSRRGYGRRPRSRTRRRPSKQGEAAQRGVRRPACTSCGTKFTDERREAVEETGWSRPVDAHRTLCGTRKHTPSPPTTVCRLHGSPPDCSPCQECGRAGGLSASCRVRRPAVLLQDREKRIGEWERRGSVGTMCCFRPRGPGCASPVR